MSIIKSRLITLGVLILGLYVIFNLSQSTYNLWQRAESVEEAQEKRLQEEKRNRELRQKLEFTQSQEFIEREIRDKLGLVKPEETVVIIQAPEATPSAQVENLPNWKKWLKLFF